MLAHPLEGCIIAGERAPWQGLRKIEQLAGDSQALEVPKLPGFFTIEKPSNPKQEGWFIPENLVQMGMRGGQLDDYAPEPHDRTPSGMPLEPYQARSVAYFRQIDDQWGGAILGAEPGLGKTICALQALWLDGFLHKRGLVVAPNRARSTWCSDRSDAVKHYDLKILPLEGMTPDPKIFELSNWFFIHYDILHSWYNWIFLHFKPESLIVDESHYLMNPASKRSKACHQLSKAACIKRRLLLSGTPIPKTRGDLWGQLATAQPNQWDEGFHSFGMRYMSGRRETLESGGGHFVYDGQSNTEELRARLCGVYLRYTEKEAKAKLPTLVRRVITLDKMELDLTEYWEAQAHVGKVSKEPETQEFIEINGNKIPIPKTDDKKKARHLTSINTLICLLEKAKIKPAIKEICMLAGEFKKIIVFCWQREVSREIEKALKALATPTFPAEWIIHIDGSIEQPEREERAMKFAQLERAVVVATRASMGEALNELQTAEAGIQITPDWNPSGNIQAERRWHRKGNPNAQVVSVYLRAPGTTDDLFIEKLDIKAKESAEIAPHDQQGMNLVADLIPQGIGGRGDDLDEICAILAEMEDDI